MENVQNVDNNEADMSSQIPEETVANAGENDGIETPQATDVTNLVMCDQCSLATTGHRCVCGGTYCYSHRHSANHDCQFDFELYMRGGRRRSVDEHETEFSSQAGSSDESMEEFVRGPLPIPEPTLNTCDHCYQPPRRYHCDCKGVFCIRHREQRDHRCPLIEPYYLGLVDEPPMRGMPVEDAHEPQKRATNCDFCYAPRPKYHCACGGFYCHRHRKQLDHSCDYKERTKPKNLDKVNKITCDRCSKHCSGHQCACGGTFCKQHLKQPQHNCLLLDPFDNGSSSEGLRPHKRQKRSYRYNCQHCHVRPARYHCQCGGEFCKKHRKTTEHICLPLYPIQDIVETATSPQLNDLNASNELMCEACNVAASGYYCACGGTYCKKHAPCIKHNCRFQTEFGCSAAEKPKKKKDGNAKKSKKDKKKDEEMEGSSEPPTTEMVCCLECQTRVLITSASSCHCGGIYCVMHRFSVNHACNANFSNIREGSNETPYQRPTFTDAQLEPEPEKVMCDACYDRRARFSCFCGGFFCYRHRRSAKHECISNGPADRSEHTLDTGYTAETIVSEAALDAVIVCNYCSRPPAKYSCFCSGRYCEEHRIGIDHNCMFINEMCNKVSNGVDDDVDVDSDDDDVDIVPAKPASKYTGGVVYHFDTNFDFEEKRPVVREEEEGLVVRKEEASMVPCDVCFINLNAIDVVQCMCGGMFCYNHGHSEEHNCYSDLCQQHEGQMYYGSTSPNDKDTENMDNDNDDVWDAVS